MVFEIISSFVDFSHFEWGFFSGFMVKVAIIYTKWQPDYIFTLSFSFTFLFFFICQLHNWSRNLFIFISAYVKHTIAWEKLLEVGSFPLKSNGNIVSIVVASPFFSG